MHLLIENPNSRECITFTCNSCSYKADVYGEIQKDYRGTFETFLCMNCKILLDTQTETAKVEGDNYSDMFVRFTPIEPKCLCCDKSDLIKWDSEMGLCPKCNEKMEQTRLEINVDRVGTVRIVNE